MLRVWFRRWGKIGLAQRAEHLGSQFLGRARTVRSEPESRAVVLR